ncbi:MAG TPA: VanZ family protein [Flavisolibacter sp.]|nr:VanZ family protein [Flavisolibacter sp.]
MFLQSSFFIYVFMVLTLTGYFILFREVSAQDWWSKMQLRIQHRDHVNLTLLQVFKIYKFSDKQVLGNLVMLLPLGIYLPLLYKLGRKPLNVIVISFMASAGIELLQLATRFRSADVDDILLNTLGACMGYVIFAIVRSMTAADGSLYNNNDTPLISTR